MSQPNILMIMADQLAAAALGAYGHRVAKTPHVDALAESGVLFENCYCNAPLCVPSRASLVTGQFPSRVGSFDNGTELPAQIPTFLHHLRRTGYRTISSGKQHFIGPDQLHGYEERLTTDIYPSGFDWTPDWSRGVVRNTGSSVEKLKHSGVCRWSMQLDYDEEVHFRALERLRSLADADDGRPFFLCASYTHPHQPYVITQEYWDRFEPDAIDDPAVPAAPHDRLHPYDQWIQQHHSIDLFPPSLDLVRTARRAYYGMVSYWDQKVGELVGELRRLGLDRNTVVLVLSDHGDMMGEHGMWSKRTFYDWSARVPLICACPERWAAGRRVPQAVSLVDLFPTLLDLAGVPDHEAVVADSDGASLVPVLEGDAASWKDEAVCEYCGEGTLHPARMVCRGRHKYVYVAGEAPRLFDLEDDPTEQADLCGRPELAGIEAGLSERALADWDPAELEERVLRSQRDRRLILEAIAHGRAASWDYQPYFDASRQYVR